MDLQQILYIYCRVLVTVDLKMGLYNWLDLLSLFCRRLVRALLSHRCIKYLPGGSFLSRLQFGSGLWHHWWVWPQVKWRTRLKLLGLRHTMRVFVLLCPPTAPMQSGELWRWKWKEAWDKSSSDTSSSGRIKNQVRSINIVVRDFNISAASRPSAAAGNRQAGFNLSHPSLWRIH